MTNGDWCRLGTEHNEVKILAYDPSWPEIYRKERQRILLSCPNLAAIEHIGSTSIPGMDAKPIIDIMLGIDRLDQGKTFIDPMSELGYEYLGEYGIPGRLFFVLAKDHRNLFHCHMFVYQSWQWRRHLYFRDYLIQHPQAAQRYLALKLELANQYRYDRNAYSDHKTSFVCEIEAAIKP